MEYVPFGGKDKIKLSIALVKNLICVKTKSGKTCSDNDAMKFLMMCQARLLNPYEGDSFLIGYDGKDGPTFSLITAHQAFLKRAELNPEYDGMKSGIIVEDDGRLVDLEGDFFSPNQKVVGGWATVFFKNRKQNMHKRIRLQRFQKAWGIWQDDPAGMICKCAEADALRSSFPTMLGGLYLKEEMQETATVATTTPIFTEPPKEAVQEAEVIEAPKPAKSAPAAKPEAKKTPPKAEVDTPVSKMRVLIAENGLTVEKVLGFLKGIGSIEESVNTIEELAIQSPEVLEMLGTQHADIFDRIKQA